MRGRWLLLTCVFSLPIAADQPIVPHSYTKTTAGGEFIFAMIAPDPKSDETPQIRNRYAVSGLYKNDGSTSPIWTVDWWTPDVIPLSDGIHLVEPAPWPMTPDYSAVSFYANGRLIREYKVSDLVLFPQFTPHSASHFFWKKSERIDDEARTYTVTTLHLERYVFDITTGKIISRFSPFWIVELVGIFGLIWGFTIWRRHRLNKPKNELRA